jgi:hypothetical protein
MKATENARRLIFFWKGVPRPVEADESLSALLSRRDEVRQRTAPKVEPNPDLFRPVTEVSEVTSTAQKPGSGAPPPPKPEEPPKTDQPQASSSAARLLEAKRRALKK